MSFTAPLVEGPHPRMPRRRTLLWKYAAYSAALVTAVLVAVGAVTGYFAYRDAEAAQGVLLREKAGAVAIHIGTFFWGSRSRSHGSSQPRRIRAPSARTAGSR